MSRDLPIVSFKNPPRDRIEALLRNARTIAVVGLSDNAQRPSHEVATSLRTFGYRIIPVNPALTSWEGLPAIADLTHLPAVLGPNERVDIVDVFRQSRYAAGVVEDCIRLKLPAVWLQLGVVDEAAAKRAQAAGLTVVMDRCIKIDRMRFA
ncbi:MAG TPA: CoA-binding protein [Steroidobacter sp.]|jgi:hypothetical protein|nr:CoA-binding protein [Steroidobacter sp.]